MVYECSSLRVVHVVSVKQKKDTQKQGDLAELGEGTSAGVSAHGL